jgi:hypothetical protein
LVKLKIGDFEIPDRCLRYVVLFFETASVSFGGTLIQDDDLHLKNALRRMSMERGIRYEAVDINGVRAKGLCSIRNLKFDQDDAPIKFHGQLRRPFNEDL